ncbi:calcium-binding protein [Chroococcidiopsis sp. TS-821]|uniref:calcium-binding protein n=1 Tax=Chroococcidiopsis sp. TS-821 TaxID=1378066 RepID=UPI001AEF7FBC|nr:calcium-binding protein [Chroococcidiopsis sp. TS-821]
MYGGTVNDTYIVDRLYDTVTEYQNVGTDTVNSSVSFTLGSHVENLTLTGYDAISGTGNSLNNKIVGNNANNFIDGLSGNDKLYGNAGNNTLLGYSGKDYIEGGAGNDRIVGESGYDTLVGGAGADTFVFYSPYDGVDTIKDFKYVEGDKIEVSASGFGITPGVNQYDGFNFNSSTGALAFNGTQFATLQLGSGFVPSLDITIV